MNRCKLLSFLPLAIFWTETVEAHCALDKFDSTAPKALVGKVDNIDGNFTWASDLDRVDGLAWVWNYINNNDPSRPLSASWDKGGIKISFANPLPPLSVYCNKYPVLAIADDDIDDDAPIIFGNKNTNQRAAIFKKKLMSSLEGNTFVSEISSSYLNSSGEKKELDVSIFYTVKDGTVNQIGVIAPDDVYVGIDGADTLWSNETISKIKSSASDQGSSVAIGNWSTFNGSSLEYSKFVEAFMKTNGNASFSQGTFKALDINSESAERKLTDIVVFDSAKNPIVSGYATLPVTK